MSEHELSARLQLASRELCDIPQARLYGRLTRAVGLALEAVGCDLAVGHSCWIERQDGSRIEAEVVGFSGQTFYLMPLVRAQGVRPGDRVLPRPGDGRVTLCPQMLGRVINGLGEPIDGKGALGTGEQVSLHTDPINPMLRRPIEQPLEVGVRVIDGMLSVGKGQRIGMFAGSGVGKSVLLGMLTRNTRADITVVGLIGERGREVREFIERSLGEEGLANSVVIAAPADDSPVMRLRAADLTHRVAEYYRDRGQDVLLLMDSLTRYSMAQREIALAIGEPPATKGYPPSVFSMLPRLVERAGNGIDESGSITAFYTVLAEGDDQQDPIADSARAILDGHVVLSRALAESGHYPAIDLEQSISRVMPNLVSAQQLEQVHTYKRLYSRYRQAADLIGMGGYQPGADPELDRAVKMQQPIASFLRQGVSESSSMDQTREQMDRLQQLCDGAGA
ncbi:flagellar protein export ATPase FliI [Dongshaea marina]|uniref:flagellar protein export ATPase FliI n=1 Tax=Dongshaea marina TaxID=2047966 RepID=UPI000D3EB9AE|nr:flagellar protein export ATPase FliI [Dongshaea marina]